MKCIYIKERFPKPMAFFPNQVAGLTAWYDSADRDTFSLSSFNLVNSWADKSGNDRTAIQTEVELQPTFVPNEGVNFLGNQFLLMENSLSLARDTGYITGFFVFNLASVASAERTLLSIRNNNTASIQHRTTWNSLRPIAQRVFLVGRRLDGNSLEIVEGGGSDLVENRVYIFNGEFVYSDGVVNMFLDGIQINSNDPFQTAGLTSDNDSAAPPRIGAFTNTATHLGLIKEIILYRDTVVSPENRQSIEGYLAWKWNLQTSLPDTHPFRFYPPGTQNISPLNDLFLINTANNPGALLMPSSFALANRILTIKDIGGNCSRSTFTLYTNSEIDTFQGSTSFITFSKNYDFLKLTSDGAGRWLFLDGTIMPTYSFDSNLYTNSNFQADFTSTSLITPSTLQMTDITSGEQSNIYEKNDLLFFGDYPWTGTKAGFVQTLKTQATFQPDSLPSLQIWYDASDPETIITSGSNLVSIFDKSPFGRNSTGITGSVFYEKNVFNKNLGAISFQSNGVLLGDFGSGANTFVSPSISVFSVLTLNSAALSNACFFIITRDNESEVNSLDKAAVITRTTLGINIRFNLNNVFPANALGVGLDTPFLCCSQTSGSDVITRINGGIGSQTAESNISTVFSTNTFALGGRRLNTGRRWYGYLGEILVYSNFFSGIEREQVEGYLAWKWGIVDSLPSGHSFKNAPP
jgi:hypothetical protein